jgi:hypothetical protein
MFEDTDEMELVRPYFDLSRPAHISKAIPVVHWYSLELFPSIGTQFVL